MFDSTLWSLWNLAKVGEGNCDKNTVVTGGQCPADARTYEHKTPYTMVGDVMSIDP